MKITKTSGAQRGKVDSNPLKFGRQLQGRIQFSPINICLPHKSVDLHGFSPHRAPQTFILAPLHPWPESSEQRQILTCHDIINQEMHAQQGQCQCRHRIKSSAQYFRYLLCSSNIVQGLRRYRNNTQKVHQKPHNKKLKSVQNIPWITSSELESSAPC